MKLDALKNITPEQLLILQNAHIIDPAQSVDLRGSLLVQNGKIRAIAPQANYEQADSVIIDVGGLLICPGLVALQGFLSNLSKKAIQALSRNAAASGITTMLIMPNGAQIIDNVALVEWLCYSTQQHAMINLLPCAALTKAASGYEMTEYGLLKLAGAVALSDGPNTVGNSAILRQLMLYARDFNLPILHQPQDKDLAFHRDDFLGTNEGSLASWLGLAASCREAETIGLDRDLRLASLTGTAYHAAQISCAMSCEALARAKAHNPRISAAASVAHLCFNDNDIGDYAAEYKYQPPLRSEEDRQALIEALGTQILDAIVCTPNKLSDYCEPQLFGPAAKASDDLRSLLPLSLRLYHAGALPLPKLLAALTCNPARILNIEAGALRSGQKADFIIVDINEPWQIDGKAVQGKVKASFVNGQMVFNDA